MDYVRVIILLSMPVLLFTRPKFIRDYLGNTFPIVLGFLALATMALQFFIFQK
jgi:predicted ferric reductase